MKNNNTNLAQKQEEPLNFNKIRNRKNSDTFSSFTRVPKWILDVKGTELSVLLYLCTRLNGKTNVTTFLSYKTIASRLGITRRCAIQNVKKLVESGRIKQIHEQRSNGSNGCNRYEICFDLVNGDSLGVVNEDSPPSEPGIHHLVNQADSPPSEPSSFTTYSILSSSILTNSKLPLCVNDTEQKQETTHTNEFINISFEELKDILYHERLIELAMSVWEKHYLQWDSKKQFIQTLKSFTSQTDNPETILNALNDYSIGKNKPPEHLLAAFRRLSTEIQTNSRDKKFVDNFDTKCNELWGKPTWKIKEELEVEKQEKALLSEFHKNLTGLKDEDKEAFFNDFIDQGWSYVKEDPVYLEIKNASDEYYSLKEILYGIERRYEVFQKVLSGNMDDVYFYTHWLNNPLETDDIQDERMTEMKSWIEGYEQRIKREQEEQKERKKREIEEKQRKENEKKESIIKEILYDYDRMKAGEMAEDYLYQNIDIPKDLFTDERIKPVIRWHDSFRQKVLDQQIKQIMESKRVNQ